MLTNIFCRDNRHIFNYKHVLFTGKKLAHWNLTKTYRLSNLISTFTIQQIIKDMSEKAFKESKFSFYDVQVILSSPLLKIEKGVSPKVFFFLFYFRDYLVLYLKQFSWPLLYSLCLFYLNSRLVKFYSIQIIKFVFLLLFFIRNLRIKKND